MTHFKPSLGDELRRQQQQNVDVLLAEAERIEAWLALQLPDGLAPTLQARQAEVGVLLLQHLRAWRRAGGGVQLARPAPLSEAPTEPEAALEPADAPAPEEDAAPNAVAAPPPKDAASAPLISEPVEAVPAVPRPADVSPLPPPAAPSAIAALKSHLESGGRFGTTGLTRIDWRVRFTNILGELTTARSSADEGLDLLSVIDSRQTWPALPGHVLVLIISYLATRIRHLQDRGEDLRLDQGVRRLSAYQRDYNPGFVYGLARTHEPRRENWLADSEAYWDELQALLHGETEAATAPARKAPPPRKVVEGPEDADDDDSGPIPPDWEWFSRTRGKRAVMVGGDPREPNRLRLEAAFGFTELVWERAERTRNNLQMIRERVKAGKLDMVIVLTRFVGHDADHVIQPACKEMGVPFIPVQTGYGVQGFRRAMERFLSPQT